MRPLYNSKIPKRCDLQELGQNQKLAFNYDNAQNGAWLSRSTYRNAIDAEPHVSFFKGLLSKKILLSLSFEPDLAGYDG